MKYDMILLCAFRYALGRSTYIVSEVADQLLNDWDKIHPNLQKLIIDEIKDAIYRECIGMDMDRKVWENLVESVEMVEKMGKVDD